MVRTRDEKVLKEISELIESIDVPTPLVLLEVIIMEVELDRGFDTAFNWSVTNGNISGGFNTLGPDRGGDFIFN